MSDSLRYRMTKETGGPVVYPGLQVTAAQGAGFGQRDGMAVVQRLFGNRVLSAALTGGGSAPRALRPVTDAPPPDVKSTVIRGQIASTVKSVVDILEESWISDGDEEDIVAFVEGWAGRDEAYARQTGYRGTDHLDALLLALKMKTYETDSFATMGVNYWTNAYDQVWHELDGPRLQRWKDLVAQSGRQRTSGPQSPKQENAWSVVGTATAQGGLGITQGLATGLAGTIDAGSWAVTKLGRAAGVDMAEPLNLRKQVQEGYGEIGDAVFGKENWSQAGAIYEFGGMSISARDLSSMGGEAIFSLVTLGSEPMTKGSKVLTALDWAGKFKAFDDACGELVAYLVRKMDEGDLTWDAIRGDPEFLQVCVGVGSALVGALAKGQITPKEAASQITGRMATIGKALRSTTRVADATFKVADVGVKVARIAQIANDPRLQNEAGRHAAGMIFLDLVKTGLTEVGGQVHKVDEARKAKVADRNMARARTDDRAAVESHATDKKLRQGARRLERLAADMGDRDADGNFLETPASRALRNAAASVRKMADRTRADAESQVDASVAALGAAQKHLPPGTIATPYGAVGDDPAHAHVRRTVERGTSTPVVMVGGAKRQLKRGTRLYKVGTTLTSHAGEAQFWMAESPLTPDGRLDLAVLAKYGIPPENVANANFVQVAEVGADASFAVRKAADYTDPKTGRVWPGTAPEIVTLPREPKLVAYISIDAADDVDPTAARP